MKYAHWLILLLIVVLAAVLRLHRVAETPGWYSDEGTHLEIAQHLAQGHTRYFALDQSTLLVARLPVFELLLAAAIQVEGVSMRTLRLLTGVLGVLAVTLLYVVTRLTLTRKLALLAALMLAIYPQAVLYSRFGFSYNLLAPLTLLVYLGLVKYCVIASWRWLALAAIAVGIGLISDIMMGTFTLPVVIVVLRRHPRDLRWAIPLMVAPFALYAGAMLFTVPDAFLFDLHYTLTRLSNKPLFEQVHNLTQNYTILLSQDFWLLAGLIGLFVLSSIPGTTTLLLLLLPVALLGRTVALHSLSAYYMIPLLPFVALGAASFVAWIFDAITRKFREASKPQIIGYGLVLTLVVTPLVSITMDTLHKVNSHYPTAIDPFLLNPDAARYVAAFINGNTAEHEVVIASPGVGWMFDVNTVDFQMTAAYGRIETPHFPADIPKGRFAFDPRLRQAHFVVVDNLWGNWGTVHIPAVAAMQQEAESWPLVLESDVIRVYENPTLKQSRPNR